MYSEERLSSDEELGLDRKELETVLERVVGKRLDCIEALLEQAENGLKSLKEAIVLIDSTLSFLRGYATTQKKWATGLITGTLPPLVNDLTDEEKEEIDALREELRKDLQAIEKSSRLTAADYAIRINAVG